MIHKGLLLQKKVAGWRKYIAVQQFYGLFLISAFLGMLFCSFDEMPDWNHQQSDVQELGVLGAVKSISQRMYEVHYHNNIPKKRHLMLDPLENWDIELNKKGYITQKKCYDAGNELIFYYDYKYKRKTQLLKRNMYDHRNYRIEQILYVYNSLGQLAAESIYKGDNDLLVRYVYTYSGKGRLTETSVHAPTNLYVASKYKFLYDQQGQLIKQETYNRKEQLHQTDHYIYDENAYVKEHRINSHSNKFSFTSYARYDDRGNLITYQAPSETEPLTSYTYTFDEVGNWLTKTHYQKGKAQDIVERVIVYE